jgi:hypothetical protein
MRRFPLGDWFNVFLPPENCFRCQVEVKRENQGQRFTVAKGVEKVECVACMVKKPE